MLVIDPRAGAGLRPYRAAFKANYITAMGLYFINDPDDYWIEILPVK